MIILVKAVGVLIVLAGIIYLIRPEFTRNMIDFWRGPKIYPGAVLSIAVGVIFLLAASNSRLRGVIILLGILSLLKGVLIFAAGTSRTESLLNWWAAKPDVVLRIMGIFALAIGVLIIYAA